MVSVLGRVVTVLGRAVASVFVVSVHRNVASRVDLLLITVTFRA